MTLLTLLAALPLLAPGCARRAAEPPAPAAARTRTGAPELPEPGSAPRVSAVGRPGDGLPRLEISVSHLANLVHWIDCLAGSSGGKTVRTYRVHWTERHGPPSGRDLDLLSEWRRIRSKRIPLPERTILNDRGCLPQVAPAPGWRQRFQVRSYEADTIDAFVDSMREELSPDEMAALREILEAFRPRFDEIWRKMTFLGRFEGLFRSFLESSRLRPFLGEMAAFFGVEPETIPPARIHLMALPGGAGTHAQADGEHLMMEIRPGDTPLQQVQVIAHEMAHYFWFHLPPERNDALARQVYAASERGPVIWRMLREGLPTALGQGLAEARLAPSRFGMEYRWYHIDEYDRFAKAIYPAVASAFREGRRIEEGLPAEISDRAMLLPEIIDAFPGDYLAQALFAVGGGMFVALREVRSQVDLWNEWRYALSDPDGADLLRRYGCLSGVVLLGPEESADPAALPEPLRPPPGSPPPGAASGEGAGRSYIRAARRPGGGMLLYLVAARQEDVPRLAEVFRDLDRAPLEPLILEEPR